MIIIMMIIIIIIIIGIIITAILISYDYYHHMQNTVGSEQHIRKDMYYTTIHRCICTVCVTRYLMMTTFQQNICVVNHDPN